MFANDDTISAKILIMLNEFVLSLLSEAPFGIYVHF